MLLILIVVFYLSWLEWDAKLMPRNKIPLKVIHAKTKDKHIIVSKIVRNSSEAIIETVMLSVLLTKQTA